MRKGLAMSQADPVTPRRNAPRHLCIPNLLADYAKRTPYALAILAPGRAPLTYGRLQQHLDDVCRCSTAWG